MLEVLEVLEVLSVLKVLVLMVLMVLTVPAVLGAGQPLPVAPRDRVISGRVIDAVSGRPVSAAFVSISGANILVSGRGQGSRDAAPQILTDSDGRFVFSGLVPGSYMIRATKGGYAEGASGRWRPGGPTQPVVLTATANAADVAVRIWKYGAIAGTVTDETGEPVINVQVRAVARSAGTVRPFATGGSAAVTDDRGMFRISALPGDYLIMASQPPISAPATWAERDERPASSQESSRESAGRAYRSARRSTAWVAAT